MRIRSALPLASLALAVAVPGAAQAAPTLQQWTTAQEPTGVAAGSDGNVWITQTANPGALARVTPSGTVASFPPVSRDGKPRGITAGPGGLWFVQNGKDKVGRMTTAGVASEFSTGKFHDPTDIAAGGDGNLWFTAAEAGQGGIVRMTPSGTTTAYKAGLAPMGEIPSAITAGPDGALWFVLATARKVGRITTQGTITTWSVTGTPYDIAAGPDGALWFTQTGIGTATAIGRITTAGVKSYFTSGLPLNSAPRGITAAGDGALAFTDRGANAIGRITTTGVITMSTATGLSASAGLEAIATGGDGRLWFTENAADKVGRLSVAPGVGAVTTAGITKNQATISSAVAANSETTSASFEYGTTPSYGTTTSTTSRTGGGTAQAVTATLTGLLPSTLYHVRAVAANASGTTVSADRTFTTTAAGAPSATTLSATGVTAASAALPATINPEGAATSYRFEWGPVDDPQANRIPLVTDDVAGSGLADLDVSQQLDGLEPHTSYAYRVRATSSGGTTRGETETFTTDAPPPAATTDPATGVDRTGATLTATVDPRNSETTYAFEWGTTEAYGNRTPDPDAIVGGDHAPHAVAQDLAGLNAGETYHFRVVATSDAGVTEGADRTFTTPPAEVLPVVTETMPAPAPAPVPAPVPPAAAPAPEKPRPVLGRTAVVSVTSGTVRFRAPGAATSVAVTGEATIPTGSVLDTRSGRIALESAVDAAGTTQSARFRGAMFRMALSRRDPGLVTLTLTERPTGCTTLPRRAGTAVARAAKAKRPVKLWSSDRNGKYRTQGRNSVAVVRGTEWTTEESCAGTVTRVIRGAVEVRDRRTGKRVLVRAGHSYLARPKR